MELSKEEKRLKLQEMVYNTYKPCWVCGKDSETKHHVPPRCANPRMQVKIPICKPCHTKLNKGWDYTAKEKKSLRANIKRIKRSIENIEVKVLGNV